MKFIYIYLEYYLSYGIIVLPNTDVLANRVLPNTDVLANRVLPNTYVLANRVFVFAKNMSTIGCLNNLPSFRIYPNEPCDLAKLEAIMRNPLANFASTIPILSYQEEINLLESALSVLTRTKILPGAITLEPQWNDMVVSTGFHDI